MIYFDNAATGGTKPDGVITAVTAALKFCANPGRSGHKLSIACLERVYAVRQLLCEFFGGYSYERVVFTKNCTEALNLALLGTVRAGDEVITTVLEHNSVLRPLEFLRGRGVKINYITVDGDGNPDLDGLKSSITKKTKAAVITLASNVTGVAPDIEKIKAALPENCLLICDGAQACGHAEINLKGSGIDALAVAGHKGMHGIQGSGALIFSERFNPAPVIYGGTGSESRNLKMPDFYPDALESGTLSYPAVVSLGEGALYLKENMAKDNRKVTDMTAYVCAELEKIDGVKLYSKPNPYGIVALNLDKMQSEFAAYTLSETYGICVRGGLHCAPLVHEMLGTDGLVRASLSAFNDMGECEEFVSAIREMSK